MTTEKQIEVNATIKIKDNVSRAIIEINDTNKEIIQLLKRNGELLSEILDGSLEVI